MSSSKANRARMYMSEDQMIKEFIGNKKHDGIVYIITDGSYFKIGVTKSSVKSRIETMQTGNANKLQCVAFAKVQKSSKVEKALHKRYEKFRHRLEWFKFDNEAQIFDAVDVLRKAEKHQWYLDSLLSEHEKQKEIEAKQRMHQKRQAGIADGCSGISYPKDKKYMEKRIKKIQAMNKNRLSKRRRYIADIKADA